MVKRWLKHRFKQVSWNNKLINALFKTLDIPDWIVRQVAGHSDLPKYSIRVRSNGITQQFGGKQFARNGEVIANILMKQANLDKSSKVIEIGCGCGRVARVLTRLLPPNHYIGMDVDPAVVAYCQQSKLFKDAGFRFDRMDIRNAAYNPNGEIAASEYAFPYDSAWADVVFHISVFTHMLPEDVRNYIAETARLLRPGGRCLFSAFLMDHGHDGGIDFPHDHGFYRLHHEELAEKAVGYNLDFFESVFAEHDMVPSKKPLIGGWRGAKGSVAPDTAFGQDILIFEKSKSHS